MSPSPAHIMPLIGRLKDTNKIVSVPNILVIRKGLEKKLLKQYCSRYKYNHKKTKFVAFVSSPYIYTNSYVRSMAQIWFHPFRNPENYLPDGVDRYFMPESDFVDVANYDSYTLKEKKWDYFYFTLGGDSGRQNKGYSLYKATLRSLSHLKGIVIVYGKSVKFPTKERKELQKKGVKVILKKFNKERMHEIYSCSRFALFPNEVDCSPRMIPECLVHNTPVLVNKEILGWRLCTNKL